MTGDVVTDVIALAKKKQHRMFFVLCASASLRHLHPTVAAMLKDFIDERRRDGLLFSSRTGKQLCQSNILRRWLHPILAMLNQPKCGAHAFRRFRLTHIRKRGVPKDLGRFWMGHDDKEIGDIYSKLKEDVEFRQGWTKRIGLGLKISSERGRTH